MSYKQLEPLDIEETTGEPYLRLPTPHDNIIITPPRMEDGPRLVEILTSREVQQWLTAIPKKYNLEDAEEWLTRSTRNSNEILKELREEPQEGPLMIVGGCPVTTIREVQGDGTQVPLGSIEVFRGTFRHLGEAEAQQLTEENGVRDVGDPGMEWEIGDYLAVSHHGRGIMTAVVGACVNQWIIPRMGGRIIRAAPYVENIGSIRVFEKNGFTTEKIYRRETINASGDRHGGQHSLILGVQ